MRTTLTLEKDIAAQLRREMRRSGASLKAAVNHFLRLGLASTEKVQKKPFVVEARPLGLPPGLSYDNIGELLEALDGPLHK
ncbi:MAG TPA: hypothetical protein VOA78_12010 [Candidatus Dormibacteraeota bacterium]|nr:hypothetical protein [Candidatus Dormibacteraeota bacterium]